MDERIRQEYRRIYSEMYVIVLCLAAASVVIKVAFFQKSSTQLGLEYVILVGSPVYRFIRCRMLGVTAEPSGLGTRPFMIRMAAAVILFSAAFAVIMYFRNGKINLAAYAAFVIPFLLIFLLTALVSKKIYDSWRKKLERKYND